MLHRFQLKTSIRTITEDASTRSRSCTVPATVAVLSLFLAFIVSTMAYAQAPAGPNRPAGVPDGYVITPFGYFHPSCVRQLTEGETLLADGIIPALRVRQDDLQLFLLVGAEIQIGRETIHQLPRPRPRPGGCPGTPVVP